MFEQELDTAVIAASLKVDDQTVRRWRRIFADKGREGLRSRKHAGRPSRLTPQHKERLVQLLLKTPMECGFSDKYLWTQQLIADLIAREFGGIRYHHDHVGVMLHELGFTHQKPARRARERDESKVEAWRRDVWPDLLKKAPGAAG
jgi:transposase